MSDGAKPVTIGYFYYASIHLALCHGEVDEIRKIKAQDTIIWGGKVLPDGTPVTSETGELAPITGLGADLWIPDSLANFDPEVDVVARIQIFPDPRAVAPGARHVVVYPKDNVDPALLSNDIRQNLIDAGYDLPTVGTGYVVENPSQAVRGPLTESGRIVVAAHGIFGGNKKEGGITGIAYALLGAEDQVTPQPIKDKLTKYGDPALPCPDFRGVTSLFLDDVYYGANNARPRPWFVEVKRIPWKDHPYNTVNGEANGAYIVAESLTDVEWGMGYPLTDLDLPSFQSAAQTLQAEGLGISILWKDTSTIEEFVNLVLQHINATVYVNPNTGLFTLKLIRGGYDFNTLPLFDESNIISAQSYGRSAVSDLISQLTVKWLEGATDKWNSITVHNTAIREMQGKIVSVTREYPGFSNKTNATFVANRDLAVLSQPLAKVTLVVDRSAYNLMPGDVIKWDWADYGIIGMPLRILAVKYGAGDDNVIQLECVEDIFGAHLVNFTEPDGTEWVNPNAILNPSFYAKVMNVTYHDLLEHQASQRFIPSYLEDETGYVALLSSLPDEETPAYELFAGQYQTSPSGDVTVYSDKGTAEFIPIATLTNGLEPETHSTIQFENAKGLARVYEGTHILCGDEIMLIQTLDTDAGTMTCARGMLDTVPTRIASGEVIWFYGDEVHSDAQIWPAGVDVAMRAATIGRAGVLPISQATLAHTVVQDRWNRPYPPGKVLVNSQSYPTAQILGDLTVTWAHRDRITQELLYIEQDEGDVGPEQFVSYAVRVVKSDGTIVRTVEDILGTQFVYDAAMEAADLPGDVFFFFIYAIRINQVCIYPHVVGVSRTGAAIPDVPAVVDYTPSQIVFANKISVVNLSVKGLNGEFFSRDAVISWENNADIIFTDLGDSLSAYKDTWFKRYNVRIKRTDDTLVRSFTTVEETFTYTYELNAEDANGPTRDIKVEVELVDYTDTVSTPAVATFSNPPPILDSVTTEPQPGKLSVYLSESDLDFEYCNLFASKVSGFTPDTTPATGNLVYSGSARKLEVIITEPDVYYYRVQPVDSFGPDPASITDEYTTEVFAPDGWVAPTALVDLYQSIEDFDPSNNLNGAAIVVPVVASDGTAIDHTVRADGTINLSFEWTWPGAEQDIDGFVVLARVSDTNETYWFTGGGVEEYAFVIPRSRRSLIAYSLPPNKYYTLGVVAYRKVDTSVDPDGLMYTAVVYSTAAGEHPYYPAGTTPDPDSILATVVADSATWITHWDRVVGDHRPDDDADVTADNTAGSGVNIMHHQYSLGDSNDIPPVYYENALVSLDAANPYLGFPSIKIEATLAANASLWLAADQTDYNVLITPNKKWIISAFVNSDSVSAFGQLLARTDILGNYYNIDFVTSSVAGTWTRVYGTLDLTADGSDRLLVRLDNDNGIGSIMRFQGIMIEEQVGNQTQPSTYAKPASGNLVAGVPADKVAQSAINYTVSNDNNGDPITDAPFFDPDPFLVAFNDDGSCDVTLFWDWAGDEGDIDGFVILGHSAATGGVYNFTLGLDEVAFFVPASQRSATWTGISPTRYYTVAVAAYRKVRKDISASGEIHSSLVKPSGAGNDPFQPASSVSIQVSAINGVPASDITDAAVDLYTLNNFNSDPIAAVSFGATPYTHYKTPQGTIDLTVTWAWTGDNKSIDGFGLLLHDSTVAIPGGHNFTVGEGEFGWWASPDSRSLTITGLTASDYYTAAVVAYRRVDSSIAASGIIASVLTKPTMDAYQPETGVEFNGNVTGNVDGVPAYTIATYSQDAYNGTVQYRTPGAPTNTPNPNGITITENTNGTRDITLSWDAYVQGANLADFLLLFYKEGTSALTVNDAVIVMNVNTANPGYIKFLGIAPDKEYRAGIAAARATNNGMEIGTIIQPTSPDTPDWVASAGEVNFTGKVGGRTSTEVADTVAGNANYIQDVSPNGVLTAFSISVTNTDEGNRDISLVWTYVEGSIPADGFIIFHRPTLSSIVPSDPSFKLGPTTRSYTFQGLPQSREYRFGIAVYKKTDTGIKYSTIQQPIASPDWRVQAFNAEIIGATSLTIVGQAKFNGTSIDGAGQACVIINDTGSEYTGLRVYSRGTGAYPNNKAIQASLRNTTDTDVDLFHASDSLSANQNIIGYYGSTRFNTIFKGQVHLTGTGTVAYFDGGDYGKGLYAVSSSGYAIDAASNGGVVIRAVNDNGTAIEATTTGANSSLLAQGTTGDVVRGKATGSGGKGVVGEATGASANSVGVFGYATNALGIGMVAQHNASGVALSVIGDMKINNTNLVTNLNADLLDGKNASAFMYSGVGGAGGTLTPSSGAVTLTSTITNTEVVASGSTWTIQTPPSDINLKKEVEPEFYGLDFINRLNPVTYRWKENDALKQHGFIYQEMKAMPEFSETDEDVICRARDSGVTVDQVALIPVLVKAIQELTERLEKLESNKTLH